LDWCSAGTPRKDPGGGTEEIAGGLTLSTRTPLLMALGASQAMNDIMEL
jgi:hypothetical protein